MNKGRRLPVRYSSLQSYPTPFNPSARIEHRISNKEEVSLKVIDVLGREVATLVDGVQSKWMHSTERNPGGRASGVYFYKIRTGIFT